MAFAAANSLTAAAVSRKPFSSAGDARPDLDPEPEPEAEPPTVDGYNGQWYATINNDTWRSVCTAVGISTDRQLMYFKWIKKYFKIGNDKAT